MSYIMEKTAVSLKSSRMDSRLGYTDISCTIGAGHVGVPPFEVAQW